MNDTNKKTGSQTPANPSSIGDDFYAQTDALNSETANAIRPNLGKPILRDEREISVGNFDGSDLALALERGARLFTARGKSGDGEQGKSLRLIVADFE